MTTIRAMESRRCLRMTTRDTTRGKKRADHIDKALGRLWGKPLTGREVEVVGAILAGHTTNQQIAQRLVVTRKTTQTHLGNIYAKTGAQNHADLILMALGRKACAVDLSNIIWE